jgi:hypothetical protein
MAMSKLQWVSLKEVPIFLRFASASFILLLGLLSGRAPGDEAKDTSPRATGAVIRPAKRLEVRFHDGSVLRNLVLNETIELQTKYGKLAIPIDDVRRIEFGLHIPLEVAKKIEKAVDNLGSDVFQEREAAGRELVALGRYAYPALKRAGKNAGLDMTRRVEALINEIQAKVPDYQLRLGDEDVVHTTDSMIAGQILWALTGKSDHLGKLQLHVTHLRDIRTIGAPVCVTVDVASYQFKPDKVNWLATDFVLEPGRKLLVTASGQVDLNSNGAKGQILSSPDGNPNLNVQVGNAVYPCGMLLGRIGDNGSVFRIGTHHQGTPAGAGRLYLSIIPYLSTIPAGSYEVKISEGE